jgi:hypothetical protein
MSLTQTLDVSGRSPDPERLASVLADATTGPQALALIGNAVAQVVAHHFEELHSSRTHGYSASGFYEQAARGTGYTDELGYPAVVTRKLGIGQRLHGGPIVPREKTYLAIPNSFSGTISATYGHSPLEFANLVIAWGRQKDTGMIGPIGLRAGEDGAIDKSTVKYGRNKKGQFGYTGKRVRSGLTEEERVGGIKLGRSRSSEGEIMFWLVREVWQGPDPSVVPDNDTLEQAGYDAVQQYVARVTPDSITVNGEQV